jgi:protease I
MSDRPLEGKKIALLVETEYILGEIEAYEKRFGDLGATVHVMSRLWDQLSLTFASDVDEAAPTLAATQAKLKTMDVSIDIMDDRRVRPENYDAVLMAAASLPSGVACLRPRQGSPWPIRETRFLPAWTRPGGGLRTGAQRWQAPTWCVKTTRHIRSG